MTLYIINFENLGIQNVSFSIELNGSKGSGTSSNDREAAFSLKSTFGVCKYCTNRNAIVSADVLLGP